MKSFIAALSLIPALVWANAPGSDFTVATVDTICVSLKQLTEITDEAKELPYVRGQSHPIMTEGTPLSMVIFVNPTTGTFTIAERVAICILSHPFYHGHFHHSRTGGSGCILPFSPGLEI